MIKRIVLKIYGDVHGVSFRYYTWQEASRLNLTGWVRNEPDGTVKIVAEGEEENLKKLIDWCYNGVRYARVDKVDVEWQEAKGEFEKFEIKYN